MTPQHRQQLEELAKWHEEQAGYYDLIVFGSNEAVLRENALKQQAFHRSAAKLLREVVEQ